MNFNQSTMCRIEFKLLIILITSTVNVKSSLVQASRLLPRQQPKCVTTYPSNTLTAFQHFYKLKNIQI